MSILYCYSERKKIPKIVIRLFVNQKPRLKVEFENKLIYRDIYNCNSVFIILFTNDHTCRLTLSKLKGKFCILDSTVSFP